MKSLHDKIIEAVRVIRPRAGTLRIEEEVRKILEAPAQEVRDDS
jgi:hypothetical protein